MFGWSTNLSSAGKADPTLICLQGLLVRQVYGAESCPFIRSLNTLLKTESSNGYSEERHNTHLVERGSSKNRLNRLRFLSAFNVYKGVYRETGFNFFPCVTESASWQDKANPVF